MVVKLTQSLIGKVEQPGRGMQNMQMSFSYMCGTESLCVLSFVILFFNLFVRSTLNVMRIYQYFQKEPEFCKFHL